MYEEIDILGLDFRKVQMCGKVIEGNANFRGEEKKSNSK